MNPVFEIAIFVAFILLLAILIIDSIRSRIVNTKLNTDVAQGLLDMMALKAKLEEKSHGSAQQKIEETEGFLKFVSQSRDWAFQYIESVQISIKNFQDVFHPIAKDYYKNKDKPIDQETFGRLVEAYKKLVDELPDEGKKD
jgi:hypothetical protein